MKFKLIAITLTAMALIVPVDAKNNKNNNNGNAQYQKAQQEKAKKKAAEKAARDKKRDALQSFMKNKDTNHDGSLTREEYFNGERDATEAGRMFDQFNANKDRYLSKPELEALLKL